jgi:hypothetical protein
MSSAQVYEQVFLVNNIPEIAGIFEARDMIKRYVLTDIWHMKKAYEFAERFKHVNETIRRAYSRNTSTRDMIDRFAYQFWEFGFDMHNNNGVEKFFIFSANCCVCGEYAREFNIHRKMNYCECPHNQNDYYAFDDHYDEDGYDY